MFKILEKHVTTVISKGAKEKKYKTWYYRECKPNYQVALTEWKELYVSYMWTENFGFWGDVKGINENISLS